jgi:hypothetical protein
MVWPLWSEFKIIRERIIHGVKQILKVVESYTSDFIFLLPFGNEREMRDHKETQDKATQGPQVLHMAAR